MNTTTGTGDTPDDRETNESTETTALDLIEEQAEASIRREWRNGKCYFAVVDVIALLTDSAAPLQYWRDTKTRMRRTEGWRETQENLLPLRLRAADGKQRLTDAADTETLLRIIQSVPSPKAEPVKQWLARVGAKRLDEVTQPLPADQFPSARAVIVKPAESAPALEWAEYHERMASLYRRIAYVDSRLDEHDEQIAGLEDRMEGVEEGMRMLPEILERLGPQTLTSEHQSTVKNMTRRLSELTGIAYAAIYAELDDHFHVAKYDQIPDAHWVDIAAWFQRRIDTAEKRRSR